ncbi:hypothetical protein HYS00_04060 [Candidatus Microgenomates bacterium]|nr:hypothetical protein [Candidatus Microgenomates bacterium]
MKSSNLAGPVLIITSEPDPHADEVIKHLAKKDIEVVRLNSNRLSAGMFIKYDMPPHRFAIISGSTSYELVDFRSIWYRKPDFWWDDHEGLSDQDGLALEYKYQETKRLIENLMFEAEKLGIYTISPLSTIDRARNRTLQLPVAQEAGMKVPASYIGSSIEEIERFVAEHPGAITKPLSSGNVNYGKYSSGFTTAQVDISYMKEHVRDIDYPIYIQEYIEKQSELRVTIVGSQVFACSIDTQSQPASRIDSRLADIYTLPHHKYELPSDIQKACLHLCKKLGLKYAAIDLAITPQAEFVFFEINANGQYLWIEELTNMPISATIASHLALRTAS